jgi:hypothetical protein
MLVFLLRIETFVCVCWPCSGKVAQVVEHPGSAHPNQVSAKPRSQSCDGQIRLLWIGRDSRLERNSKTSNATYFTSVSRQCGLCLFTREQIRKMKSKHYSKYAPPKSTSIPLRLYLRQFQCIARPKD